MSQRNFASLDTGLRALEKVIRKALAERNGKPFLLGIVGPSGSGKTFLEERLMEIFPGASCLPTDNYYYGPAYNKEHGIKTFDEPGAVNLRLTGFHCALFNLRQPVVFIPLYSYDKPIIHNVWQRVHASPLIIVDGLFILEEEVRQHLDYVVFVDVSSHSALWRRIARDTSRTGQTPNEIAHMFISEVYPGYAKYVLPKRPLADMVIRNDAFPREKIQRMASTQAQVKILLNPGRKICAANQEAKIAHHVLLPLGFFPAQNCLQRDAFFLYPDASKGKQQDMLRFRSEVLSGGDEEQHTLSYRFPRLPQTQVAYTFPASAGIEAGLRGLGYAIHSSITKNRWLFKDSEGNEIALDTVVAQNGSPESQDLRGLLYAEIRSSNETKLRAFSDYFRRIGFPESAFIDKSYYDLLIGP